MRLVYTNQAAQRLKEIILYLERHAGRKKAMEVRKRLLNSADQLLENPQMGRIEPYLTHLERSHRRLVVKNYKIIYRLSDANIYITDIFDTRQDPADMKG